MSAGIEFNANVLNQLGTPAMNSNLFANRPAAGFTGRIFISTDTREIYRDTGTTWELIGSGGGSVNIYNSDGTLTGTRTLTQNNFELTFIGGLVNFGAHASVSNTRNIRVNQYASLGTITTSSYGAVGSNFYVNGANSLRTVSDSASAIHFLNGGHVFLNAGNGAPNSAITWIEAGRVLSNGRLLWNTTTDAGFLLDINGTSIFRNNMRVDAQSGIRILNAAGVTNSGGYILSGASGGGDLLFQCNYNGAGVIENGGNRTSSLRLTSGGFSCQTSIVPNSIIQPAVLGFSAFRNETSGGNRGALVQINYFEAATGNAGFVSYLLTPNINFTGSYNGGTLKGIYYNPTLTSLTGISLHYAFESTQGRLEILNAETPINTYPSAAARFLNTHNIPAASSFSGGLYFTASASVATSNFAGSTTFGIANVWAAAYSQNLFQFQAAGSTVTVNQVQKRAISAHAVFNQFGGTNSGTITDLASLQILGFYNNNTGVITPVVTNAIQLLINNLNDYSHTFTLSNRWGIWQDGSSDNNYFAGKVLIGTTTVTARPIHIAGDLEFTTTLSGTAGGTSGQHLIIYANGNQYKIKLENP